MTSSKFTGWAALKAGQALQPYSYEPRPLYEKFVEVEVEYCAICYSDIHAINNDWADSLYPLIPGHEITGRVVALGPHTTTLAIGDRVGIGPICQSCLECPNCQNKEDPSCDKAVYTYNDHFKDGLDERVTFGGYADKIRVHEEFVFKLPSSLPSDLAAPLLCAGLTVYTPLRKYLPRPGAKVGVVGIGGLGHLTIQYAAKMGAYVIALSHSDEKRPDALTLGAKEFINYTKVEEVNKAESSLDLLINTSWGKDTNFDTLFKFMQRNSRIVMLGAPAHPLTHSILPLVWRNISLTGSLIGSRQDTREMLQMAAEQGILPWIQKWPMSKVNEAVQSMKDKGAKYRLVLYNE